MKVNPAMLASRMGRGLSWSASRVEELAAEAAAAAEALAAETSRIPGVLAPGTTGFDCAALYQGAQVEPRDFTGLAFFVPTEQGIEPPQPRQFMLGMKSWKQFYAWALVEFSNGEITVIGSNCVEARNERAVHQLVNHIINVAKWATGDDIAQLRLGLDISELRNLFKELLAGDRRLKVSRNRRMDNGANVIALEKANSLCVDELFRYANPSRVVYTDGSHRWGGRQGGAAWVDTEGHFWLEAINSSTALDLEIAAICNAIIYCPRSILSLTVRTDSQAAIDAIERLVTGRPLPTLPNRIKERLERLREALADRGTFNLQLEWIKGHSGEPLNECADRLALLARRLQDAGVEQQEVWERAREIVGEVFQLTPTALDSLALAA